VVSQRKIRGSAKAVECQGPGCHGWKAILSSGREGIGRGLEVLESGYRHSTF
jgi:hypothetical protein